MQHCAGHRSSVGLRGDCLQNLTTGGVIVLAVLCTLFLGSGCSGTEKTQGNRRAEIFGTSNLGAGNSDTSTTHTTGARGPMVENIGGARFSRHAAAIVAPMGRVRFDGQVLPLVRPSGKFIAVQEGASTSWKTLLARNDAPPAVFMTIVIYRIGVDEQNRRPFLEEHQRLEEVGFLGRGADDDGFLIESPQFDGSRAIGKVDWQTGAVDWILKGGSDHTINAFASIARDGRLAWCARSGESGNSDKFDLYIQGNAEVFRVPAGEGEWLFPIWANDGRTLFVYRLHDTGELEITAFDARSKALVQRPMATRRLVVNGNRYVAYQSQAALQQAAAPDATPRLLLYLPGPDCMGLFDPRVQGIRRLSSLSFAGSWRDSATIIVGGQDSVSLEDAAQSNQAAVLLEEPFVARRTSDPQTPFVLFAPVGNRMNDLNVWVMDVFNDPQAAEAAVVDFSGQR